MLRRCLQFARYSFGGSYLPPGTNNFVIVGMARTGSTFLAGMLDSHPGILCHHELFNPTEIHRALKLKGSSVSFGTVAERDKDPWAFLRRVLAFREGGTAVGFKILSRQNPLILVSLLLNRGVRKIILFRRQLLEQYVSQRTAEMTDIWSSIPSGRRASPAGPVGPLVVDTHELRRFIRKNQWFYQAVKFLTRLTRQPAVRVAYEDLRDPRIVEQILTFLEVDPKEVLTTKTEKQATGSLEERIRNYAEVKNVLMKTRFRLLVEPDSAGEEPFSR